VRLPYVGLIAAGSPFNVDARREWRTVRIPRDECARNLFVVSVRGDSLSDDGIQEGMLAICKRAQPTRNGELCAVLTPDGPTLKYVYWGRGGRVILCGASSSYEPQCYYAQDITIQGIVLVIDPGL
jgi:SOS-response transcriptional repressor LexA